MMEGKIKTSILLLIVLIIISLALAGSVLFLLQKEKTRSLSLQQQLEETTTRLKMTEARLDDSKKVAAGLDSKLKEASAKIDKLTNEVAEEKSAKEEALVQAGQLKADLERQKGVKADLESKLTQAQRDVAKAQGQVKDLSSKKDDLEKKVKDLEARSTQGQGVELGTVVVTPEAATTAVTAPVAGKTTVRAISDTTVRNPAPAGEGKVLVINGEYNFAVINLGSKDGVELGQVYSIYRGNKYIGDVKVEKVHDSMAAAGFLNPDTKDKVTEGDKVVRKSK
ncbi:MAG: hypothetical protein PHQ57_07110 [Candidatus Omnitrophica bacterium]|nr:hypothetical protein [Candidatus Omnitrophota bacterium]